jgi:uncharacterized membrane protein
MAIFIFLLWALIINIIRGAILSVMWTWFIVPLGVHSIGVAWAVGISVIVGFLTIDTTPREDAPKFLDLAISSLLTTLLLFGMGAIAHYFMHN